MALTISNTDVVSQFGAYYINEGQNIDNLKGQLFATADTESLFPLRVTDETIFRNVSTEQSSVLQPFQSGWTPMGNLDFEPLVVPLYRLKIDLETDPENLVASYLGFLAGQQAVDRGAWPFVRWWLETCIIPKAQEDRELNEVWGGVFAAPTAGTAGAAGTSMNGIRKQLKNIEAASSGLNLALGALPTSSSVTGNNAVGAPLWLLAMVDYIETFCATIPAVLRAKGGTIAVSDHVFNAFRKGQRQKYNLQYEMVSDFTQVVEFPQFTLKRCLSMGSSDNIWWSPDMNKVRLLKAGANENVFKIETVKRAVSAYTDWWFGLGFIRADYVVYNGQDLT